jgi:hypothetical protein
MFDPDERQVVYPFEVDRTTRLAGGKKAGGKKAGEYKSDRSQIQLRQQLLVQAQATLERARLQDAEYPPTYINLACVTDLLGRADEAALRAHQAINVARRMDNPIALSHALVARGIARLHGTPPDSIGSRQDFTAAQTNAPLLAGFNLALLNGTANERVKQEIVPSTTLLSEVERIGGLAAMDYGKIDPKKVTQMPRDGPGQPAFSFYRQEKEYWTWLILDTSYNLIVFLETQAGYDGTTVRGVRVGDERAQVEKVYGSASYLIPGPQGVHHVYPDVGLIMQYGGDERVEEWILFYVEE